MKLILFDCDGTLVDSESVIHGAMVRSFDEAGIAAPSREETRTVIGRSLHLAIAQLLPEGSRADPLVLTEAYKRIYSELRGAPDWNEPLYDGIADLLDALSVRDDLLLGIVTGKSRRGVRSLFETHGLQPHFTVIRTADDCPSKPDPSMVLECCRETGIGPEAAIVVGDSLFDIEMAVSAGASAVGVSWGYGVPALLNNAGAKAVIDTPQQLPALIERL